MTDFKNIKVSKYDNHLNHSKYWLILCIVFIISIVIIVALSFSYNIKVNHKEVNISKSSEIEKDIKEVDKELKAKEAEIKKREFEKSQLNKKRCNLIEKIKEHQIKKEK